MKPSEQLKSMGFINTVNNMGLIVWERRTSEQYLEVLEFNSSFTNYATFIRSGKFVVKPFFMTYELHKVINAYMESELYWK
jgi:hypothetical protein